MRELLEKRHWRVIALGALLTILAIILITRFTSRTVVEHEPVYVREYDINLWKEALDGFFKEPFEILVLGFRGLAGVYYPHSKEFKPIE